MEKTADWMLQDLRERYDSVEVDQRFLRLYSEPGAIGRMFAHLHQELNRLFEFMNQKASTNGHFNAHESRELVAVIEEIRDAQQVLNHVGMGFGMNEHYREIVSLCNGFLSESNGSEIPVDFPKIQLVRYETVFSIPDTEIHLPERGTSYELKMKGEGAFAFVYAYVDPEYDERFALKRAKKELDSKDLERFRREFDLLRRLSSPYVLKAYRYNDDKNEYTMEYCDSTLAEYISQNNGMLSFSTRKRVALQVLYGLNYLHTKDCLHRDISNHNVLVKRYDGMAVVIKLSDFGLAKKMDSDLTRTESEIRGTVIDPTMSSFKEYGVANEIYAIGHVLSFIFTGQKGISGRANVVQPIINKCVSLDVASRYPDVRSIIGALDDLDQTISIVEAETPA